MDTKYTDELADAYQELRTTLVDARQPLPKTRGKTPDLELRRLDCAVLSLYFTRLAEQGKRYDTVRCGFVEGPPVFEGSGIRRQTHVQVAVRNPACVVGVFRPRSGGERA
jgi:hypothetical protein